MPMAVGTTVYKHNGIRNTFSIGDQIQFINSIHLLNAYQTGRSDCFIVIWFKICVHISWTCVQLIGDCFHYDSDTFVHGH